MFRLSHFVSEITCRRGNEGTPALRPSRLSILALLSFMIMVFFFPVSLIRLGIIPFADRFRVSAIILTSWLVYTIWRKHGWKDLGFRCDNLKGSLFWNSIFCAAGGAVMLLSYLAGYIHISLAAMMPTTYLLYVFFFAPVQELVFRGILFADMKKRNVSDYRWLIAVSTISFCYLHIIYKHPAILGVTLISGLVWSTIYNRYPNIWGVSISHAVLGSLAIVFGLI